MDVEKSSLCNCVVNFLLEENYLLTAFELLHELLEDGRDAQAIRLNEFFCNPSHFPPDQISRFNALRAADPQNLLEEKEALEEKLAIKEYELRLAREDLLKVKADLQRQTEFNAQNPNGSVTPFPQNGRHAFQNLTKDGALSDLGPLNDIERRDLNCAIKEYLILAGYRLTAMTFCEEVTDQDLDAWHNPAAHVPDALRHYYYEYLSTTAEAAEEKIAILKEKEALTKANLILTTENESLVKHRDLSDGQIAALTKSLESAQKDLNDKEILVQTLKSSLDHRQKELNDCRSEITSLKMHIEGSRSNQGWIVEDSELKEAPPADDYAAEIKNLRAEIENLRAKNSVAINSAKPDIRENQSQIETRECHHTDVQSPFESSCIGLAIENPENDIGAVKPEKNNQLSVSPLNNNFIMQRHDVSHEIASALPENHYLQTANLERRQCESISGKGLETIHILSSALPKIVPYVLINHREELLPLIMCAIECHPDSSIRDSLTHTLFNLIKRPDEKQRQIIMDACVTLAKNVGEMRTESELLPQCWEQINHIYEERRLLVAQSCGVLAEFVRPEIRDSLILSIVQQLVEDSAMVVRESAAHNLALLLRLFPNMDKYFKVEELMFQLLCDPSGLVVETTLKELVPVVICWGNKLDHVLRVSLSHILGSARRCPPLSGVDGSVDSHLRVLGEREHWSISVLLRLLTDLLPFIYKEATETCPFSTVIQFEHGVSFFSTSLLELYAGGHMEWLIFDWMHTDCFPGLIELACLLPYKEDNMKRHITKFLLAASEIFGEEYSTHILLPIFLVAVGDDVQLTLFPSTIEPRIAGLRPKSAIARKLAIMCVLPLLLVGIFGASSRREKLTEYLRKILIQNATYENSWLLHETAELIDAIRFLCTFEENHGIIFNILWEMVVSSNVSMKTSASYLLKALVPCVDERVASTHVLPALVTLGSDQNLNVKYASIEAFGAVAQHFKNDTIVDKIRIQMDAFLDDGSHEATVAVIHSLAAAIPHTTERLRDYVLGKILRLTSISSYGNDVMCRRERANVFCETIRALDATDLPAYSIREHLLPAISNILKDSDALDPAHKEALEVIMRERSGGTLDTISKVMGAHRGLASSMGSLFSESGLLGKKESGDPHEPILSSPQATTPRASQDDTRFRRIMKGNFGDVLRGRGKIHEDSFRHHSG